MLLNHISDYGLFWPKWLAWAGIGLMAAAMLLLVAMRRPAVNEYLRKVFLHTSTLRGRLLLGFGFVASLPLITLPPLIGAYSAGYLQDQQVGALEGKVQTVAESVPRMFRRRVGDVSGLAEHISAGGDLTETALAGWLLRHHTANTEIVSMWVARPDGHIVVATAARHGNVERWGGPIAGVGGMDYFRTAVDQGGRYVSDVRKGVAAGSSPMVFVSEPILDRTTGAGAGQPWGYLQAQLDLSKVFRQFVTQDATAAGEIFMTDAQDRVMLSSPQLRFSQFESLGGHPLLTAMQRRAGATSFAFAGDISATEEAGRFVAAYRQLPEGWKVFAVAPQQPVYEVVYLPLVLGGVWALFALLLVRGFAGLFGDAVAQPLKTLDESLDNFDAHGTISMFPHAPSHAPSEVHDVYEKVRESMRKSRDAYRKMMQALSEGAELKRRLHEVSGSDESGDAGGISVIEGADASDAISMSTFCGPIDTETHVAGQQLFREFFNEAWNLGVVAEASLALIMVAVGSQDDRTRKAVADGLGDVGGRKLDLIARIGMHEFAVVLPDTDLEGALAVAGRAQLSVRKMLVDTSRDHVPQINFGVVAIVPRAEGNAKSFVDVGRRVLKASHAHGDGCIAYADDKGKIRLATRADLVEVNRDAG